MKVLYEMVKPTQWMFLVHPRIGISSRWLLRLDLRDEGLWKQVEKSRYNVHIPIENQDILEAVREVK